MEFALIVGQQIIIMFLLIFVGFFAYKIKMIDRVGIKQITDFLLYIITPAIILSSFTQKRTDELLINLLIAFGLAILSYLVAFAVAYLLIRNKNNPNATIERFAIIYPNNGFMGIPLAAAVLGAEGVFYTTAFICIGNVFTWTHGISIMMKNREDKNQKMKLPLFQLLLSPALISFLVGLIVFLFAIPIPEVLLKTIDYIGALNTPIAMLVVGVTLAQTNILSAFKSLKVYKVVALSNLLVPLIVLLISIFIPVNQNILINNIIISACPAAAMTIIFAEKYHNDAEYATKVFTLSSLMTIITMPPVILFTTMLLT